MPDITPAVIITGDVHHHDPNLIKEQRYYDGNEPAAAVRYARILGEYGLEGTLFYTGLCFKNAWTEVQTVAAMKHIEIGGHTYNCYQPKVAYKIWGRLTGNLNGPGFLQALDVQRTLRAAKAHGIKIKSWRNHAYRQDRNTLEILARAGITHVSNEVSPDSGAVWSATKNGGLLSVGINVWPDHEHIIHGDLTAEKAAHRRLNRNRFPNRVFQPLVWLDRVVQSVDELLLEGRHAVLLVHPGCMMTLGDWSLLNKLCIRLSNFPSCKMNDIID